MPGTKLQFKANAKNIKIIVGLLLLLLILLAFIGLRDTDKLLTHNQANTLFTQDKIEKLIIDGEYIRIITPDERYKIYQEAINKDTFFAKYPIEVKQERTYIYDIFMLFFLMGAFWFMLKFLKDSRIQQLKQIRSVSKEENASLSQPVQALTSTVTFKDVAGIEDVKEELEEIIDFLREPQKYKDLDIRLPKGVLLVGPPGVGKTLISKAVAGEADVPFFYQSGASFVQIYVGMGAKRVSELFKKAKQMAPSIIFIDEIDAVGKSRGEFRNDEREATLNQLLTEMDGFEDSSGVIVIGATNKVDVLDEALLRSGRFDRRIHISLPDIADRAKTLELYLANKAKNVNIEDIARTTVGFNSAALATLTNEAAIFAMREGRDMVETSDFEAVKDKVLLGKKRLQSFTNDERKIQAVYQGAKALCATWLDVDFEKIGIVITRFAEPDKEILSKSQLLNRIKVYLAGSIATKKAYNEQFTNASADIAISKELAHKLIYDYAMSENFTVTHTEVETLLKQAKADVIVLLEKLEVAQERVSTHLLEEENITQVKCKEILRELF
jgi:ATP-dependent metalloprotease FtsH